MKVKILRTFRKYWDYRFTNDGRLVVRRKADGLVRVFDNIEAFVRDYAIRNNHDRLYRKYTDRKRLTVYKKIWAKL